MPADSAAVADAARLLRLALERPHEAEAEATALLAEAGDPWRRSVARHTRGLAMRERGDVGAAVTELRHAARLARSSADPDRLADVRATLGGTLVVAGRTTAGLHELDAAVAGAQAPPMRATVLMRRGFVLSRILGRYPAALADVEAALAGIRASDDRVWEARTLNTLAGVHLAQGHPGPAAQAIVEAQEMFAAAGQLLEATHALSNRGLIAFLSGDLPTALRRYDEATARFAELGVPSVDLALDHGTALLSAGLAQEAAAVTEGHLAGAGVHPVKRPELLLALATSRLAAGEAAAALDAAREARSVFRRQQRDWWARRADLAALRARYDLGDRAPALAGAAADLATALEADGTGMAATAWLVAGRMAAGLHLDSARALLDSGARHRRDRSALVAATGWLARAVAQDLQGNRRGVLAACRRGLDALDEHRRTLGSSELRALAAGHGEQLSALAVEHAARSGPRVLLAWSERWRATALSQPPVRPPEDAELAGLLAAARDARRRVGQARSAGASPAAPERDLLRAEAAVRRHLHHRGATGAAEPTRYPAGLDIASLIDAVGQDILVELVRVGDGLVAVLVTRGRVRSVALGPVAEAERAAEYARFALRQGARGRPGSLAAAGRRLQDALLGPVASMVGDGAVVVSPTAALHGAPWGLLPVLADRPVSVVPSAATWLRARTRRAGSASRVLVVGPGLTSGGAEVAAVAARHPGARVLRDGAATVEACLGAFDGAWLAHVAAHGRFRPDSPMFSSVDLDDGPLTVHDFERLRQAPYRFVLSACESGVMAPLGAGELLGLAAALFSLGTAGVLSSVVQVDDLVTAALMPQVHAALDDGAPLGEAMRRTRRAASGDRVAEATAAAFVPLGV